MYIYCFYFRILQTDDYRMNLLEDMRMVVFISVIII